MKAHVKIIGIVCCLMTLSCQQDVIVSETETANSTLNIPINAKNQVPNVIYDSSTFGIYHGVIVSLTTQKRGKLWVNLNNDGLINAYAEMVDGSTIHYRLKTNLSVFSEEKIYDFVSNDEEQSSFTIDLRGAVPQFTDVVTMEEAYHIAAFKSRSAGPVLCFTGKFGEGVPPPPGGSPPPFSGTWSLIADGTNPEPNSPNGTEGAEGITQAIVTYNGNSYTDETFEIKPYPCQGVSEWIPEMVLKVFPAEPDDFISEEVFAPAQVSPMAGTVNWYLFQAGGIEYFDENCDNSLRYTLFSWTNTAGTDTKNGYITMDFLPE